MKGKWIYDEIITDRKIGRVLWAEKFMIIVWRTISKVKKSSPIAFIGFDCPLYLLRKIKEGFIELEQLKENKKEFKSDLNKIVK